MLRLGSRVHLTDAFDIFLSRQGPLRCRFPWCKDVSVDQRFWESLVCLDPTKKGWIMDEHIELWVNYMWHFRPHDDDWAMVCGYFVQLLLQDSIPSWYANGSLYKVSWCNVEEAKFPKVMMQAKVFDQKGIDYTRYTISFTNAVNVPKQGGVFGDCGTNDRGCGYFMWMDDFRNRISSLGPSTPPTLYTRPLTRPSYSAGTFRSAMNVGKAECSNCKFLAKKIKTLEEKIKTLEGTLEMERHHENHTIDSAAILHELYNDMGKLGLE
ncbi:hypothetical protein Tco_1222546 [Tanacetum coccineum]